MKIIVFGATGSLGQVAVQRFLDEGHRVTAFARNPDKMSLDHAGFSVIAGDALASTEVNRAVAGHDAVVIALGAGWSRTSTIRSAGTLNIIRAMHAHGIRRLICQSTLGTFETRGNLDFIWKYIMFGLLLRPALKDHELQEQLVRASGLDWTIVRPSAFADGPETGAFKEDFGPKERLLSLTISRADIAAFITRLLAEHRYTHRAVAISN